MEQRLFELKEKLGEIVEEFEIIVKTHPEDESFDAVLKPLQQAEKALSDILYTEEQ